MSKLLENSMAAERANGCVFAESFRSVEDVIANGGTIVSVPTFNSEGMTTDGTDDEVTYGTVESVKSVTFWVNLSTTTQNIMQLSSSHSITVSGGTITAGGFSSPSVYVGTVKTTTIGATLTSVTVTTATAFDADAIQIGHDAAFGAITIKDLKMFNTVLIEDEAIDYATNSTFSYENGVPTQTIGSQLVADGDMEAAGTTAWTANGAALTKQTTDPKEGTQCLRVTSEGATAWATQAILTAGKKYLVTGWARAKSGAGSNDRPDVFFGAKAPWSGTTTTTEWQKVEGVGISTTDTFWIGGAGNTNGDYTEWDDIKVFEVSRKGGEEVLDLVFGLNEHDKTNNQTLDRSGKGNHATLGAGDGGATTPTKVTSGPGYSTDSNDYLKTANNPIAGTATITSVGVYNLGTDATQDVSSNESTAVEIGTLTFYSNGVGYIFYSGAASAGNFATGSELKPVGKYVVVLGLYDGVNTSIWENGAKGTDAATPVAPIFRTVSDWTGMSRSGIGSSMTAGGKLVRYKLFNFHLTPTQVQDVTIKLLNELTIN